MPTARRLLSWLGAIELWCAILAFILVVALSAVQIVLRSAFGTSIIWAQEVAQLGMLVSYFLGAAYIYKQRQYMVVEFFTKHISGPAQYYLYLFAQILTFAFALMMAVELIEIAPAQLRMRTFILRLPRFYSSLPVIAGSISIALSAAYYTVAALQAGGLSGRGRSIGEVEAAANPFSTPATREVVL